MASSGDRKVTAVLAGSDFGELDDIRSQANVLLYGLGGSGKSTFGLDAPGPIAFINFDRRARHAVKRAQAGGKQILYMEVDFPANITKLEHDAAKKVGQACVNNVIKNFEIAVKASLEGKVRSIVLDTATEYAEILKIAVTGRVDRTKGDYGQSKDLINREFWKLCNLAREGNAHFILLSRAKEVWENNEPTGRSTFRGPDVMNDAVDWAAHIRLKKGRKGVTKKEFEIEVTKAGINIDELGAVYSAEEWSDWGPFVYSCMLQYGTGPEEWQ